MVMRHFLFETNITCKMQQNGFKGSSTLVILGPVYNSDFASLTQLFCYKIDDAIDLKICSNKIARAHKTCERIASVHKPSITVDWF